MKNLLLPVMAALSLVASVGLASANPPPTSASAAQQQAPSARQQMTKAQLQAYQRAIDSEVGQMEGGGG